MSAPVHCLQLSELKSQALQFQTANEDQRRLETNAARDIKDVEAMLRGGPTG